MTAIETGIVVLGERSTPAGIGEELARAHHFRHLGRFESVRAALDAVRLHQADVLVVELSTVERLHELADGPLVGIGTEVVVVSALPAEVALLPAMGSAGRAFLRSPLEPGLLERAVSAVLAGQCFVDPSSTRWLVELALQGRRSRRDDGLTVRQWQVVELVRSGLTNREIGRVLGVSLATVKSHLHTAMQQLGAGDRWAATVLAERLRHDRP